MAVEEIRSRPALVHPPRTLNVQKFVESRASELESLHSVASNRLDNDFKSQRNKRRRTRSHDNRLTKKKSRKRKKIGLIDKVEPAEENGNKKVPRRIRRRLQLSSNPERGFCASGDGTKRLRTHLWHAKRFRMSKHWGFHLPEGLHGSGRGSRALLKWFKRGTVVHDASYHRPVQLEGPEDSLMSILRMVLVPTPSESTSVLSGVCYGSSMLYHVGAPIAPVTYMWRPVTRKNTESESLKVSSRAEFEFTSNSARGSPFRQLWVWIHAAAFAEGYDALTDATQKQNSKEMGICVNCFPLDGHLSKLEIMGSKAIQVLQKILHPVSESLDTSFHLTKCIDTDSNTGSQISKSYILEHAEHLPSGAILSMTVKDPRDLPKKGIEGVMDAHSGKIDAQENCLDGCATLGRSLDKNQEIISSLWSEAEANSVLLSDYEDMWRSRNSSSLPLEENLLCMEKHERRMAYFNMNGTSSRVSSSECMPQSSRSCPVLLLKDNDQRSSYARWCIILPLSWVKAFWLPLVSSGARAIGFREKHQIACDVGLPSFPFGFPDSKAYSSFKAEEAAVSDKKLELRPPAMRPPRVPIPPPWSIIKFSVEGSIISEGGIQASCKKSSSTEINLGKSCADLGNNIHSSLQEQDESFFEGSIARTSDMLRSYMNEIHGDHLLLFPDAEMRLKAFSEMLNSEGNVIQTPQLANPRPANWKPCFLRVHIRAYKEGVFEDGAVVCVPRLSDFSLWISRSDDQEERLQIPESYIIKSCYVQRPYGKSELKTPEHSAERDSFRCPIGFVTAGFVLGSVKPVAEAFCESYLLAELRREQWESMQEKQKKEQEIFVLVRNPRSVSYRLALATIILEQKAEDVEFM